MKDNLAGKWWEQDPEIKALKAKLRTARRHEVLAGDLSDPGQRMDAKILNSEELVLGLFVRPEVDASLDAPAPTTKLRQFADRFNQDHRLS